VFVFLNEISQMKVLYLFNNSIKNLIEDREKARNNDRWLYGLLRLGKYGIKADYLELEKFLPAGLCKFLRKYLLTMHYAHLPLFPLFFRYDMVFTSTAYGCLILKALLHIRKFKWIVLDFNVLGTIGWKKTLKQKIYSWAVSKADGVVCISEAAAEATKERFPHLAHNIIFLHEATNPDYFKPQTQVAEKDMVISVGNFGRDFETVIEAVRGLNVELCLATKLLSSEKDKAQPNKPSSASALPPYVTARRFPPEELLNKYAEAKLAVVAVAIKDDYYDSVGTFALGEAMAMGKAVIATRTKNMESYIEDGVNGVFVPYKDASAIKNAIQELLGDEKKRKEMGQAARKFAEEYLDPERFAQKISEYFKSVASKSVRCKGCRK
jgi:glycosyltransferase involved in cell wall biosynthesis